MGLHLYNLQVGYSYDVADLNAKIKRDIRKNVVRAVDDDGVRRCVVSLQSVVHVNHDLNFRNNYEPIF